MRRLLLLGTVLVMAGLGCSASNGNPESAMEVGGGNNGPPSPSGGGGGSGGTASGGGGLSGTGGGGQAGVLTAGLWNDGINYDFFKSYLTTKLGMDGDPGFAMADYDASHTEFAERAPHALIDAALVVDTTGSMTDEIAYITAEFANISGAISAEFPGADQRWALVVYRDTPDTDPGDDYVMRFWDFTSDMQTFASTVGEQQAANGGDYPESPEIGLEQLKQLSWRTDPSVAKLAFWVADAPQHDYRAAQMKQAIQDTHGAGIHLYPVSGSGTDDLLELTMRTAAEITGGSYLFLTDDSGVGDPHKVPEIPCYFVTRLEKDLVRVAAMELSGAYVPPASADVLRTEGSPTASGSCTTAGGQTVQIE